MEKLQEYGWYVSEHGYDLISDSGSILDIQKIIKRCLDFDLREIGSGQGSINNGNLVLQIQKLRNVSAPKNNEESRAAPRMLRLSLTDGKNNVQAVEIEHISALSLNTPPGTKILIKSAYLPMARGILLLRPSHISVLGGKVTNLVEKWELNRKLASHTRVRPAEEGGPPPWIPFGKKIIKVSEVDKNFKALAEKEKVTKENTEFEAQRKDAIAEAAKQGCKKVFGGGNKQLLDHSIQRIIDHGFSIEQAEHALRINRNNVDRALKSLQKIDNKHKEPREPRGKRFEKKTEESKPSSGKISLFDFLEDKLPVQHDIVEANHSQQNSHAQSNESNFENVENRNSNGTGGKSGRSQKGRGYQAPPRHSEENKNKRQYNNSHPQYSQHNGSNAHQNKPPRFQRAQESHNVYQTDGANKVSYQKPSQSNDYRNTYNQSRLDNSNIGNNESFHRNHQDQQEKNFSNRNYNHLEGDTRNKNSYDATYGRHVRAQDGTHRAYATNTNDKNYKNQQNRYQPNEHMSGKGAFGPSNQKTENQYGNNQSTTVSTSGSWVWRVGDKCLAKYWEDDRYYNAVVTAVSDRTCVVQFKGFKNYEEVLQADCLPITEDEQDHATDSKRQDARFNNKPPRYDHNHVSGGMEFRRGGSTGNPSNKGYGKKRGQRSSQPIYQPPAQRNQNSIPTNTQTNHN